MEALQETDSQTENNILNTVTGTRISSLTSQSISLSYGYYIIHVEATYSCV